MSTHLVLVSGDVEQYTILGVFNPEQEPKARALGDAHAKDHPGHWSEYYAIYAFDDDIPLWTLRRTFVDGQFGPWEKARKHS